MPPISRRNRLIAFLEKRENQRAKRSDILVGLSQWMTATEADRAIDEALADTKSLITATRGNKIAYWGLENRSTVALYDAVGTVFSKYWGPREFGLKQLSDDDGIRANRPRGRSKRDWSLPDLVAFAHPRRKRTATSPREIHSFEIEQHKGFKIQSIYQAYEQARGANYAWVFAHAEGVSEELAVAARDLGVGVVTFVNPNSYVTYSKAKDSILPKRRDVPAKARRSFLETVGLEEPG